MDTITMISEVQAECDRIAKAMGEKGLIKPFCGFDVRSHQVQQVFARWERIGATVYDSNQYEWFKGDTIGDMIAKADAWLAALPSVEDRLRSDFTKLVAEALEFGRVNGFDDVLVNPLAEAMERLSKNALEHHALDQDLSTDERAAHSAAYREF